MSRQTVDPPDQLTSRHLGDGAMEFHSIVEQMADAVIVIEPAEDSILYANPQACGLLGYTLQELRNRPASVLNPEEIPELLTPILSQAAALPVVKQLTFLTKAGGPLLGEIAASEARVDGRICLVASIRDITARMQEAQQRVYEAMHDPLTGLPNRALFEDRFNVALRRKDRSGCEVAVILFDLDGFKAVNDTYGHEAGDQMLRATASSLRSVLRPADTAARFGGDEFIILCEGIENVTAVLQIARRVTAATEAAEWAGKGETPISLSMGIALTSETSTSARQLISNADAALYRAKTNGRGRYELFDEEMRLKAQERLQDEIALQHAIEHEQLKLVFQPLIDLGSGEVAGGEALLRWEHPQRGLVEPIEFVKLAEETNLIQSIGGWALREACFAAQRWRTARPRRTPLTISVNVSAKQLSQRQLVDDVARILEETASDPQTVCLEITESVIGADSPRSLAMLNRLRDLGVCLVMDDFGKGFSSLSYLRSLPVQIVKIDQSFVLGHSAPNDQALLQAAVDMAHALGLKVVAEGVENVHQLKRVLASGADLAQGFFLGRPRESLLSV